MVPFARATLFKPMIAAFLRRTWVPAVAFLISGNVVQASTEAPNDDFENRIMLSGLPVTTEGAVLPAGLEPCESNSTGVWVRHRSVWWSWVAPSNGTYAAVASSPVGTVIVGVYTGGDLCSLSLLAANAVPHLACDNDQEARHIQANFVAIEGTAYHFMIDADGPDNVRLTITVPPQGQFHSPADRSEVANHETVLLSAEAHDPDGSIECVRYIQWFIFPTFGFAETLGLTTSAPWTAEWSSTSTGVYPVVALLTDNLGAQTALTNLVWIGVTRPPNDDFAQRILIPDDSPSVTVTESNLWASVEPGEIGLGHSLWWSWSAPSSEFVTLTDQGSTIDTHFSVYTGSSLNTLIKINEGISTEVTTISFETQAGATYHIKASGQPGFITLNLTHGPIPKLRGNPGAVAGTFHLEFDGIPGQYMALEGSTNLVHWDWLALGILGGPINYVDSQAKELPRRFYRVRPWP